MSQNTPDKSEVGQKEWDIAVRWESRIGHGNCLCCCVAYKYNLKEKVIHAIRGFLENAMDCSLGYNGDFLKFL